MFLKEIPYAEPGNISEIYYYKNFSSKILPKNQMFWDITGKINNILDIKKMIHALHTSTKSNWS